MTNRYTFIGGQEGPWQVTDLRPIVGAGLAAVDRLAMVQGAIAAPPPGSAWVLHSFVSNVRYANRQEITQLRSVQPDLNRQEAVCAALIPIKKTAAWWALAQDERRAIFEEQSHHTAVGLEYLPAVARQLHHCRDLGEPFDFLTWFEFAPEHAAAFDAMLERMRASPEWAFVEREVDVRLQLIPLV